MNKDFADAKYYEWLGEEELSLRPITRITAKQRIVDALILLSVAAFVGSALWYSWNVLYPGK